MTSAAKRFITMNNATSGPAATLSDIQWAADIQEGRRLLEWFADQIEENEQDHDSVRAALATITLEDDEIKILKNIQGKHNANTELLETPESYVLPSTMKRRADYMNEESSILEAEVELLKSRLRQTQAANQHLLQAIKSTQTAIDNVNGSIQESRERIEEMSIQADSKVTASVASAYKLLECLRYSEDKTICISPNDHDALESTSLLSAQHTYIIERYQERMESLSTTAARHPSIEDLVLEVNRLSAFFHNQQLLRAAENAALQTEVATICERLDSVDGWESLLDTISNHPDMSGSGEHHTHDVKSEIDAALALDQHQLLSEKLAILQQATKAFKQDLLPPLTAVHESLSQKTSHIEEAETLCGALGEELEDLIDDLMGIQDSEANSSPSVDDEAEIQMMESKLIDLLKQLQGLRPLANAPFVVLDTSDVINEINDIVKRAEDFSVKEKQWTAEVPKTLNHLSNSHTHLLSATYANSPVNTSRPYAPACEVRHLRGETEGRMDRISQVIGELQKEIEVLNGGRPKEKLSAFVDKWVKA